MSASSGEFLKFEIGLNNALKSQFIRTNILDPSIQGYALHSAVILDEIKKPNTPFTIKGANGQPLIDGVSNLRKTAKQISDELWKRYLVRAKLDGAMDLTGGKPFPADFNDSKKISAAYDSRKRIIYFSGKGTDNFESFRNRYRQPVERDIIAQLPKTDHTRVLIEPNQEWIDFYKDGQEAVKQGALSKGLSSKSVERRVTAFRKGAKEQAIESGIAPWEGLHAGHTFGAALSGSSYLLENRHDLANNLRSKDDIVLLNIIPERVRPDVISIFNEIIKIDANLKWERIFGGRDGVKTRIVLTVPESAIANASSGGGTSIKNRFRKLFDIDTIANMKGSLSHNQLLARHIENMFLGKKPPKGSINISKKLSIKEKKKVKVNSLNYSKVNVKVESKNKEEKVTGINLAAQIINPRLHDKIRENMGKGNSKQILNYRTGRFARSVKLERFLQTKGNTQLIALAKYHGFPYSRFADTTDSLYKPGRDIRRIIGKSIKQILQEEKIASLSRVEVRLKHG